MFHSPWSRLEKHTAPEFVDLGFLRDPPKKAKNNFGVLEHRPISPLKTDF